MTVVVGFTDQDALSVARLTKESLSCGLDRHSLVQSVPLCKQLVNTFADFQRMLDEEVVEHAVERAPVGRQHVLLPARWEQPEDPPISFLLPRVKELSHSFGQQRRLDEGLRKSIGYKPGVSDEATSHQNRVQGALGGQDIALGGVSSSDLASRVDEPGMEVD